ncbi:ATP-grasp domain-containing protein [Tumebacillus lipolyticus]|uniref:ATP-grasp domain-containing protein n=1 Tax=Tumebacillus lipolyticus TaxID=1280370 RepID=A0ABW5A329_9BACL
MSRSKAIVFIENFLPLALTRRAMYAQDTGYSTYLITSVLSEQNWTSLRNFEENVREGKPSFTRICEVEHFDLDTLRSLLREIEQEADIAGLITGNGPFCKDGLVSAHTALLAEERNLPSQGSDALFRSHNKFLMRDAFRAKGMNTIDFGLAVDVQSAKEHADRIGYPVLMKPINGVASHLILKCSDETELIEHFNLAMEKLPHSSFQTLYEGTHTYPLANGEEVFFDPMRCLLIEQYIPGREVSVEVLITEDRYIALLTQDKAVLTEENNCVYEDLLITPPVRFTAEECQELEEYALAAARAIGLKNSIAHIELRYGENGLGPQVLEINPRLGGGFTHESLRTMVGLDFVPTYVELMSGTFEPKETYERLSEPHGMFLLYAPHAGLYEAVEGLEELKQMPGILNTMHPFPVGQLIHGDEEEVMLLLVWMKGESYEQILDSYQKVKQLVKFKIDPSQKPTGSNIVR